MIGDYFFSAKSIGLSTVNRRKPQTLETAAKHNKREQSPECEWLAHVGKIDKLRKHENYRLSGAANSAGVVSLASHLMKVVGYTPRRHDYTQAMEIVFSLPTTTTIDAAQYFADCVAWCGNRFGADNVLSADVHSDQTAPHCHLLIAPIQAGRWVGSVLLEKGNYKDMRESFQRQVAEGYGLRTPEKLTGNRKAEAAAMVLKDIETHHGAVTASNLWQPLRHAIERDPAPFMESMGLVLADKPAKKMKTMHQIFQSPGKGAKRETLRPSRQTLKGIGAWGTTANPIGIEDSPGTDRQIEAANPEGIQQEVTYGAAKNQSLSCVGIAFPTASKQAKSGSDFQAPAKTMGASQAGPDPDGRTVERDFGAPDLPDHGSQVRAVGVAVNVAAVSNSCRQVTSGRKVLTLASMGTGKPDATNHQTSTTAETTRERDGEHAAGEWSEELGEFVKVLNGPAKTARATADGWVAAELETRGLRPLG